MELSSDILDKCERACESWKHADDVMNEPYAPMHSWPIKKKDEAIKCLESYNLGKYELPDFNKYPLLYNYMISTKKNEEKKEQIRIKESTPEFKINKKEAELRLIGEDIKYLEQLIYNTRIKISNLNNSYKQKEEEIKELKELV